MKRRILSFAIAISVFFQMPALPVYAGLKLPDVGGFISDAADGISSAAKDAKDAVTDAAGKAGDVISDTAGKVGSFASEKAKDLGGAAAEAASQVGDLASGFASDAGNFFSEWGKQAGETADGVKEKLKDAGVTVKVKAEDLGNATKDKASELAGKAGETLDDAIEAVSGAADLVIDEAGHVVDLAAVGGDYIKEGASAAFGFLKEQGSFLMEIGEEALAEIDLDDERTWEIAEQYVEEAIETAYRKGVFGETVRMDGETIRILSEIVVASLMYGGKYAKGQITVKEYALAMSESIIKAGLPAGVGFIVGLTPASQIPGAENLAKEATYYLITKAYEDKSGDEIEAEEEAFMAEEIELAESAEETAEDLQTDR